VAEIPDSVKIMVADLLLERNEARKQVKQIQDAKGDLENVQCDLQNALNDIKKIAQRNKLGVAGLSNIETLDKIIDTCERLIGEGW
jgi:hypothetical protein